MVTVLGTVPASASTMCGPGLGWMESCTTGIDSFPSTATHTIVIFGDGQITATVSGTPTVWRGDPTGTAPNVRIPTEIVMTLTGGGLTLTVGDGNPDGVPDGTTPSLFSPGFIDEQPDRLLGFSEFNVFFELSGTPLGTLTNIAPAGMMSQPAMMSQFIDRVPPAVGTTYLFENPPVDLFNSQGVLVGQLVSATHTITPEPESSTLTLIGSVLGGLALIIRMRTRKAF
jgi:hypothetical protein